MTLQSLSKSRTAILSMHCTAVSRGSSFGFNLTTTLQVERTMAGDFWRDATRPLADDNRTQATNGAVSARWSRLKIYAITAIFAPTAAVQCSGHTWESGPFCSRIPLVPVLTLAAPELRSLQSHSSLIRLKLVSIAIKVPCVLSTRRGACASCCTQ